MVSPTKNKFKKAVQEEILTNYYLSKYDRIMGKNNSQHSSNIPHQSREKHVSKNRKNFKHVIRERRQGENLNVTRGSVERKNFRDQIQRKTALQKQSKQNRENFHKLEDSIINELYSPSPSKLESGKYHEIQIQHRTKFMDRPSQPFMLVSHEEEEAIEITNFEDPFNETNLSVNQEKNEYNRISQAIKSTFQKRTPSPQKFKSPRKTSKEKVEAKLSSNFNQKNSQSYRFEPEQSILFHESIRPTFQNLQKSTEGNHRGNASRKASISKKDDDVQSRRSFQSSPNSFSQKNSRQFNSLDRHRESSKLNKSRAPSVKGSERSYEDSLNQIIPAFPLQAKETSDLNIQTTNQQQVIYDRPPSQLRQSTHELSMISRFSMTSDEGGLIREHLDREINENQFGPYQNALSNLKDLIDQCPHAWPIFVVGQRILEDREQYDGKRKMQEKEISRLQPQVNSLKSKQQKMLSGNVSEVQKNSLRILRLVRELAEKLE